MSVEKSIIINNDAIILQVSLIVLDNGFKVKYVSADIKENIGKREEMLGHMAQYCDWVISLCQDESIFSLGEDKEINISINGMLDKTNGGVTLVKSSIVKDTINDMFDAIEYFCDELQRVFVPVKPERLEEGKAYKYDKYVVRYLGEFEGKYLFKDSEMIINPDLSLIREIGDED